jgi:hypothetical protein
MAFAFQEHLADTIFPAFLDEVSVISFFYDMPGHYFK